NGGAFSPLGATNGRRIHHPKGGRSIMSAITVNAPNRWRLETPGHPGWSRTARPGAAKKYFIVSADEHVNEPATLWLERMDQQYHLRLPRVVTDERGVQWRVC